MIATKIATGAAWMLLFKLIDRSIGIISTIVLARLLVPADFGLVAMAMSVVALIDLANSFSFDAALIQKSKLQREHYDSAWTLNVLLGTLCAAIMALLAYPVALFYTEPRLVAVMLALAAGWFISGFENTAIVDFRRQLDFRRDFTFMFSKRLLAFVLTMILAFSFRSYWALVLGTLAGKAFGVALSYLMHPIRPKPTLRSARELLGFSGWMVAWNLINALQLKVPHFAIGRVLGPQPLGLFTLGSEIAQLPASDLIAPINRAVFPGYSRMNQDITVLQTMFLDVVAVVALVALPAAAGIAAVAEPLVRTALGEKWLDAVPVIQVLAIATAVQVLTSNNYTAYLALGQPRLLTMIAALRLSILTPLVVLLVQKLGLIGAAMAELGVTLAMLFVSLPVLFRQLNISHWRYLSRVWRPVLASAFMMWCVQGILGTTHSDTLGQASSALAFGVATGIVAYLVGVTILWLVAGRPHGAESILGARAVTLLKTRWADR